MTLESSRRNYSGWCAHRSPTMEAVGLRGCYKRDMSEAEAAYADGLLDGWALAAALAGGASVAREAAQRLVPAFAEALTPRLEALADPARKAAGLRAWSGRTRPRVDAERLISAPPRERALLAPLAGREARASAANALADLPAPRRGYRPPPGLAAALAARRPAHAATPADRGRGRRLLAALAEREEATALLERAGLEAEAVERLSALEAATPEEPTAPAAETRWALVAATSHADPVGRLGQLLAETHTPERRELRELEAACPE